MWVVRVSRRNQRYDQTCIADSAEPNSSANSVHFAVPSELLVQLIPISERSQPRDEKTVIVFSYNRHILRNC